MTLILAVTPDKYELPLYVADTVREMARVVGMRENNVSSLIIKQRSGKKSGYRFLRIECEDD